MVSLEVSIKVQCWISQVNRKVPLSKSHLHSSRQCHLSHFTFKINGQPTMYQLHKPCHSLSQKSRSFLSKWTTHHRQIKTSLSRLLEIYPRISPYKISLWICHLCKVRPRKRLIWLQIHKCQIFSPFQAINLLTTWSWAWTVWIFHSSTIIIQVYNLAISKLQQGQILVCRRPLFRIKTLSKRFHW